MPTGLQIWDANGAIILDTNSYAPKFLGFYQSPTYSGYTARTGTIPMTGLGSNTPFFYAGLNTVGAAGRGALPTFTVQISGSNLIWHLIPGEWTANFTIFYGSR